MCQRLCEGTPFQRQPLTLSRDRGRGRERQLSGAAEEDGRKTAATGDGQEVRGDENKREKATEAETE